MGSWDHPRVGCRAGACGEKLKRFAHIHRCPRNEQLGRQARTSRRAMDGLGFSQTPGQESTGNVAHVADLSV